MPACVHEHTRPDLQCQVQIVMCTIQIHNASLFGGPSFSSAVRGALNCRLQHLKLRRHILIMCRKPFAGAEIAISCTSGLSRRF